MRKPAILLLIITFTLNTISCSRDGVGSEVIANAEKELPMETDNFKDGITRRINLQTVSFNKPEGFEDKSNYRSFTKPNYDKQTRKRLNGGEPERVVAQTSESGGQTAETYFAKVRADAKAATADWLNNARLMYPQKALTAKSKIFMDKQIVVKGKYPTLMLGWFKQIGDEVDCDRFAVIFKSQTTFFHIMYTTKSNTEELQKRFERMTESVEPLTADFTGDEKPTADGYIRRLADNLTLEIPTDILPDRKFVYEKRGTSEKPDSVTAIKLTLTEPDDQENLPEANPQESKYNPGRAYDGRIMKKDNGNVNNKSYKGEVTKYLIIQDEEYQDINPSLVKKITVIWARLKDGSGNAVILEGKSPLEKENELSARFEKWIQTFIPASERSSQR